MLHRAAKLIQNIYNFVLRSSFVEAMEIIDMVDKETMFVHTNPLEMGRKNSYIMDAIVPATASEQEVSMAIMHESCTRSIILMGRSIEIILEGSTRFSSCMGGRLNDHRRHSY